MFHYKLPVVGSCEQDNDPSSYMKSKEFLDHRSDYYLPKNCIHNIQKFSSL